MSSLYLLSINCLIFMILTISYGLYSCTNVQKFSKIINGPVTWNSVPDVIRSSSTRNIFKKSLKKHLIHRKISSPNFSKLELINLCCLFNLITILWYHDLHILNYCNDLYQTYKLLPNYTNNKCGYLIVLYLVLFSLFRN